MERNHQQIGLINGIVLLAGATASLFISRDINSASGIQGSLLIGFGFLVAAVSYFQMRLEERERFEKLEFDELTKAKESSSLFASEEAEVFPARRAREQFERFFIPGFTLLLLLLQGSVFFWQWRTLQKPAPLAADRATVAMSLFALCAVILFLIGKYSAGVARFENQRLLRPGASYVLTGAYVCFLLTGTIAAVRAGFTNGDLYVARGLCVLLGLIALEMLVGLILEIYRPRAKGKTARLLYESRLVGLLGQPEGLIKTAAHALDYQFGFKVSDTWFYRFLEKALAWLILLQLAVLFLSTCVVFIEPGEQGLLERLGRPVERPVLEAGPHLKFPWPIDRVQRFRTREVQNFNIGFVPDANRENERTILWTISHYKEEFNLLVASREQFTFTNNSNPDVAVPVNLLTVSIPVQYQISDVRSWAYNHANAGELLEKIATREVVRYLVGVDLNDIMSSGRLQAARILQERIQARANELKLGASIIFAGLQDIHPPVTVADAYEAVIGARQEIEAKILAAEGYQAKTVPLAQAEAMRRIREAEAFRFSRVAGAIARAAQFTNQLTAFAASPRVYPQRVYLQTLARALQGPQKIFVGSTNDHDVIQLNLENKLRPDLLDSSVPPVNPP